MSTWRPIRTPSFWKRWLPQWMHGPVTLMLHTSWIGIAAVLMLASFYSWKSSRFNLREVAEMPAATRLLDRDGNPIEAPGNGGRRLVNRDEIPDMLIHALIAREDARFFDHHGVDTRGLLRATLRNLKDRQFTQGASTLTMQLARNTFDIREKSLHRKLLEIALTLRIESHYSKDDILTHYLNRIYFGSGAYGIAQAADTYFGKPVHQLSDDECAMLAGIIRGPHVFSPLRNPSGAIEQRKQTLERMLAMGFIDDATCNSLAAEPLRLVDEERQANQTSYAVQAIKQELESLLDDESARLGGLTVTTTLDGAWQQRLERELTHAVDALENEPGWKLPKMTHHSAGTTPAYLQYAAFTVETKTGGVLALIGGRNFTHSRYDRTRSKRDLGSAFEPFVAAAAADNDKLVIAGKPLHTGRQVGVHEVIRISKLCGLEGPFVESEDVFRGAVAASPREMAVGIATLAANGQRPRPFFIREVRDRSGNLIYQAKPRLRKKISQNAATDALGVIKRRSGTRAFTGATASERDAWTLRIGPSGTTAIWIGFDQPQAIAKESRLQSLLDEFVERLGND